MTVTTTSQPLFTEIIYPKPERPAGRQNIKWMAQGGPSELTCKGACEERRIAGVRPVTKKPPLFTVSGNVGPLVKGICSEISPARGSMVLPWCNTPCLVLATGTFRRFRGPTVINDP